MQIHHNEYRFIIVVATETGGFMLILTRTKGQKIVIGKQVSVTVLNVKGRYVRIGIDAPIEVGIFREEITEQAKQKKRSKDKNSA